MGLGTKTGIPNLTVIAQVSATQLINFTMSDSDDDWFNKDENEIVSSLQQQVEQRKLENEAQEEHIEVFNTTGKKMELK